ncbi:MAG TPA: glycoside hydrolase family 2 TIM barrel-domain containing protein, partial [Vicinamibacteria bacterium]
MEARALIPGLPALAGLRGSGSVRAGAFLLALAWAGPVSAATRLDLCGPWRFRLDTAGVGEVRGWSRTPPADTEEVHVPHTWGVGPHAEHEGLAWYFRDVEPLPEALGGRVELHFGATFYKARVFVNGVLAGEHEGGHTAWFVDLSSQRLRPMRLAVEVDNRPDAATIPGWAMRLEGTGNVWYDWWHFGGLVRPVWLEVRKSAGIRRQEIRTVPGDGAASVTATAFLEGYAEGEQPLRLEGVVHGPGGVEVARSSLDVGVTPSGAHPSLLFQVEHPARWHFDRPRLYRLTLRLLDASGALLDERSDRFGVRSVEIRERGLYLNDERVRLTGVTRHQTSPWEGLAETRGTIRHDWDDLKALQVTLSRPVHYPQHPDVLDYADENGVLLVPEIPMWQFSEAQMADPRVLDLAKTMMREMVQEGFNHPSVLAWSVCNESATSTAGGRAYVKAMRDLLKEVDPGRFMTYADDGLARVREASQNANQFTDFLMMNQYFG